MSDQAAYRNLRISDSKQVIPRVLLRAMALLALSALAITTYAVVTDRPHEAQIHTAPVVTERVLYLTARADGGTTVTDPSGTVLSDTPSDEKGFITVVRTALEFNRKRTRVDGNPPVTLIRFADGRVGLRDDASGWKINLIGFGQDNARAWNELIAD